MFPKAWSAARHKQRCIKNTYHINIGRKRLFAQNMQVLVHSLDGLLGVNRGGGANDNGIETRVLQHLLVVIVESHTIRFEVELPPCQLLSVRGEGSNKLRPRRSVEEVESMALAHAAETSASNGELLRCHFKVTKNQLGSMKRDKGRYSLKEAVSEHVSLLSPAALFRVADIVTVSPIQGPPGSRIRARQTQKSCERESQVFDHAGLPTNLG